MERNKDLNKYIDKSKKFKRNLWVIIEYHSQIKDFSNYRYFRFYILVCKNVLKVVCYQDPNALREGTAIHPLSKDKGLRNTEHRMIMALVKGNLFLGVNIGYGLIFGSLSQFITKCGRYYYKMCQLFYYEMTQFYHNMQQLIQNAAILLDNVTVTTKCDVYYKMLRYNVTAEIW